MTRLFAKSIVPVLGLLQLVGCATAFSSLPETWPDAYRRTYRGTGLLSYTSAYSYKLEGGREATLDLPELDEEAVRTERQRHYDQAMEELQRALVRLDRVSAPLLVNSSRYCLGDLVPYLGLSLLSPQDLRTWFVRAAAQQEARSAARRVLGVGEGATVVALGPGSPALRAGVAERDVIRRINGRTIESNRDVREALRLSRNRPPSVVVDQRGAVSELSLEYVAACDIPIYVSLDWSLFAAARNGTISITSGLMDFAESDDELAIILGHEIAHVILEHRAPTSFLMRLSPDARVAIERDADYVGCYLAAAAGFDISKTAGLWRRIARAAPGLISSSPHEGSPERVILVEETVREIRMKQQLGLPLVPEVSW